MNRKNLLIPKDRIFGGVLLNLIPRNQIKKTTIETNNLQYFYSKENTDVVTFNFDDADPIYYPMPGTNPARNAQPIIIDEGDDPASYQAKQDYDYSYPNPLGLGGFTNGYIGVRAELKYEDFAFPKNDLMASNRLKVLMKYNRRVRNIEYTWLSDTNSQWSIVEDSTEQKEKLILLSAVNTSNTFDGYTDLVVRCSDYARTNNSILIHFFIVWFKRRLQATSWEDAAKRKAATATETTDTLVSVELVFMGQKYELTQSTHEDGDINSTKNYLTDTPLINSLTFFDNLSSRTGLEAIPYKIFDLYGKGRIYGEINSSYGVFKSGEGIIILNGLSGKLIEPYDIISFPSYPSISDRMFIVIGTEFDTSSKRLRIQFKLFSGSSSFPQIPDGPILLLRPYKYALPQNNNKSDFVILTKDQKQYGQSSLLINPSTAGDLPNGVYVYRDEETSVDGLEHIYLVYNDGVTYQEIEKVGFTFYAGYWRTVGQYADTMQILNNIEDLNRFAVGYVFIVDEDDAGVYYNMFFKPILADIHNPQENDCVVIEVDE